MRKIICLMGATSTGKTDLSLDLAERLNGEIISVDSAMIYQGMDIGTAKPTLEERRGIEHHLIDIVDPAEAYSAARFCEESCRLIEEILSRGKQPILVGGTMMYFNALFNGLSKLPPADQTIRDDINQKAIAQGWPELHNYLKQIDSVAAERIKPNDSQRISRAIEVYELTGKNHTTLCKQMPQSYLQYPTVNLALMPASRADLHSRIEKRFRLMLKIGFIDEVKQLYSRPDLTLSLPSMRCVGYRQIWEYLEGESGFDVMIERGIVATRQLAKRQLTWLRGMQNVHHLSYECDDLLTSVMRFLTVS